jgi:hypothetical protein
MKREEIRRYTLAWNPGTNKGYANIATQRGKKKVPIESPAELAALSAVLKESPVFLYQDGTIATDWEPID